ncbi:MAG: DNA repair protein RadC [Verrucomicrobia bacterium]|nr:DNA repair protein RadC [Verrucomicrobiota bacterium]
MAYRITDLPLSERPREKLHALGAERLDTAELIAILLRTGTGGRSAIEIGRDLLAQFQTIEQLAAASVEELSTIKGVGLAKAVQLKAAFALASRLPASRVARPLLRTPRDVADRLREEMQHFEVEEFHVLLLDTKNRLLRDLKVSKGTLNASLVHPREVFREAVRAGAASVILVHNHPSGDPTPSSDDIKITRELVEAGRVLKIEVIDHIIVGQRDSGRTEDFVSLKEMGLIQ